MIRDYYKEDYEAMVDLISRSYISKNRNEIKFMLSNNKDNRRFIVKEQDEKIISTCNYVVKPVKLDKHSYSTAFLQDFSTLVDYRNRGHMKNIIKIALDEVSNSCLFSMIQTNNPKFFEQFGFEKIYNVHHYTLFNKEISLINTDGVSNSITAKEMKCLYYDYFKHFDGYIINEEKDFTHILDMVNDDIYKLYAYYDKNEPKGYLIVQEKGVNAVVVDMVYLNTLALHKMVSKVLNEYESIKIKVSYAEKLSKVFNLAIPKKELYMMVRVNHIALVNKLLKSDYKDATQLFRAYNSIKYISYI